MVSLAATATLNSDDGEDDTDMEQQFSPLMKKLTKIILTCCGLPD
jgi:hypothetical protein